MKTILVDVVDCFVDWDGNIFQDMFAVLEAFPNKKILLTNADYQDTNKFGLCDAPYDVFTLKHKPKKTDPAYYRTMLATLGLSVDEVVYIEHDLRAVESAETVGIHTYWYDAEKKDLRALESFLRECAVD